MKNLLIMVLFFVVTIAIFVILTKLAVAFTGFFLWLVALLCIAYVIKRIIDFFRKK